MLLPRETFLLIVSFISNAIYVSCGPGPGTIYYRKPTKLVFYKKFPPALIYPKASDSEYALPNKQINEHELYELNAREEFIDGGNLFIHELPDNGHVKNDKYFLLNQNFLVRLMQSDEKYFLRKIEKKPIYDNWFSWLFGEKSKGKEQLTITKDLTFGSLPSTSYTHFEDSKYNNKPIYTYQPRKPLNTVPVQYQQNPPIKHVSHVQSIPHEDVKPVVEHIEGDIKYDFRTKTHSYEK